MLELERGDSTLHLKAVPLVRPNRLVSVHSKFQQEATDTNGRATDTKLKCGEASMTRFRTFRCLPVLVFRSPPLPERSADDALTQKTRLKKRNADGRGHDRDGRGPLRLA